MRAEELAAELFERAGLRILARNWRCRHGEIDLIAEEGGTVVFAEVRYRGNALFGGAAESITDAKGRIVAAASLYLAGRPRAGCRFDVLLLDALQGGRIRWVTMRFLLSVLACAAVLLAQAEPTGPQPRAAPGAGSASPGSATRGAEVWPHLAAGEPLELVREPDNPTTRMQCVSSGARKLGWARSAAERRARVGDGPRRSAARPCQPARRAPNPRRRIEFESISVSV